jgi:hypothetical protein
MSPGRRSVSDRDGGDQPSRQRTTSHERHHSTDGNRDEVDGQSARRTLQRRRGNRAIQQLVTDDAIQPKLEVGDPDDEYEREADRVADEVVAEREPSGRQPGDRDGKASHRGRNRSVRRTAVDASADASTGQDRASLPLGGGKPLPDPVRSFFEPRMGRDFGDVRIHTDDRADEAARSIDAEAFAYGRDVAFRSGAYRPETESGKRLLAHELTHVVQQSGRIRRQETEGSHPGSRPTPQEYVQQHTNLFGMNLDEWGLGADLFLLAYQSSSHHEFVLEVFEQLDDGNQEEVARVFFKHVRSESLLKEMALNPSGQDLLTDVAAFLPRSSLRVYIESGVEEWPQEYRESRREATQEELRESGEGESVSFYPTESVDNAVSAAVSGVKDQESRGKTKTFGLERIDELGTTLAEEAAKRKQTAFVRELVLVGHGRVGDETASFQIGGTMYTTEDLRNGFDTGQFARFMLDGASILLKGCTVARGEKGREYLGELGRIFFGREKFGYLKGNTEPTRAVPGGVANAEPRTLRWPHDFR